jgi:hypothetical protein
MTTFHALEQELSHIAMMLERLRDVGVSAHMHRSSAIVDADYWRRRIQMVLDAAGAQSELGVRARALLETVDALASDPAGLHDPQPG